MVRSRTPAPWTIGALIAAALAGCVGDDPGIRRAEFGEEAVFLTGQVLDEEAFPVAGATVTVTDQDVSNTTGRDGGFRIGPLTPGPIVLVTERDGYAPSTVEVSLSSSGADPIVITLRAVAKDVPYHVSEVHTTFIICWVSSAGFGNLPCTKIVDYVAGTNLSSSESFWFTFVVQDPGLVDLLSEIVWQEQATGHDMTYFIKTPPNQPATALVTKYFQAWGGSPLRGWTTAGISNGDGWEVFDAEPDKVTYEGDVVSHHENSTTPLTAVYLNHRADAWLTYFHNRAGPRDYTALPDE